MDDVIAAETGVHFFISAVTAVTEQARAGGKTKRERNPVNSYDVYPAVAYLIAFSETEDCNQETIFAALHNQDTEATIRSISTRSRRSEHVENASNEVFQVLKDHKNAMVAEMLTKSNAVCLSESIENLDGEYQCSQGDVEIQNTRSFPKSPCRMVVVDEEYGFVVQNAVRKLVNDGFVMELESLSKLRRRRELVTAPSDLTTTILEVGKIMELCDHGLFKGKVYAKPANARHTYVIMMDIESYVNKLLVNDACRNNILKHFNSVVRILSHPACEVIPQISFDYNLIEVSNGHFFKLSERRFTAETARQQPNSKVWSARCFIDFDPSETPRAGYFEEAIMNSFQRVLGNSGTIFK